MNDILTSRFLESTRKNVFSSLLLLALFFMTLTVQAATYYSTGSVAANTLTNWKTNRDGTGTSPANFTTAGDIFIIQGTGNGGTSPHTMTTASTVTFGTAANNTKLIIENGATLTASSAVTFAAAGIFQIDNGGTYNHNHSGAFTAIFGGIESFGASSNFVVGGSSSPGTGPSTNNFTGSFGNFTFAPTSTTTMQCNDLFPNVSGNFTYNSAGAEFRMAGSTAGNGGFTISGNFNKQGNGVFSFGNGSVAANLTIGGNFSISAGTIQTACSTNPSTNTISFNKSGIATFSKSGGTITAANSSGRKIAFIVLSGCTLDMGTNVLDTSNTTAVDFTVNSGAGLITANINGITSGNTASGSIQNLAGSRTFNTGGNYTFNGSAAQVTGTGFSGANNLIINNSAGVSLSAAVAVTGTVTLTSGKLDIGANNLTLTGATVSGASSSNYIVTSGAGRVLRSIANGGGSFVFPIGRSSSTYNPVTITNTGASTSIYTVGAAASTYTTAANGTNAQWSIASGTSTTSTFAFSWTTADAGATLTASPGSGNVYSYDGSIWGTTGGTTSTGTPNLTTQSGITSSNTVWTVAMPAAATAPTVTTTAASSITSTDASSGGNVTADGGATITERGIVYNTSSTPTTSNTKVIDASTGTGSFTSSLSGLTPGTTYYVRAYAINSIGTSYGSEISFTTLALPTITTASATSITATSASSGGNVTSDGGAAITERGVVYATTSNPTTSNTKVIANGTTGSFTSSITALNSGVTYYVRAYAINSVGTSYGSEISFTTLTVAPTVTTTAISSITMTTADTGGNVTSDGGAAITERGVVYSTSSNPTTTDTKVTSTGTTGSFTSSLTGLTPGTTYYVRAYAINSEGTSYGSEQSFTTLNIPTVTTTAASLITSSSVSTGGNVTANGGSSITERGIVYSTSSNPTTTSDSKIIDGSTTTGSFISSITGLTSATTYYIRAYAINAQGTAYGSNESFTTTSGAVAPGVTTAAVSNLGSSTVTVGGSLVTDGGDTVTERGIVYGSSSNPTTADTKVADASTAIGSYTTDLSGLTPGATYNVRAYAINSIGTSYGDNVSFTMNAVLATVSTAVASSVTSSSASSGGDVTADGGGTVTERGIVYGTLTNPTTANTKVMDGSTGTGTFISNLNGLAQATTYYVRAYAINSAGTSYGTNETFTTLANAPTVTTTAISSISGATASGGGNVTSDGGSAITERGIVYSTSSNPTTADTKIIDGLTTTGSFTSSLTGLTALTTYYVRAYATNSIGTSYGSEVSFTTISEIPSSQASGVNFTSVGLTSMTINFTAGNGSNRLVFMKAGSAVNVTPNNSTSYTPNSVFGTSTQIGAGNYVVYNGTGNSVTVTGLSSATTYYVSVTEYNGSGGTENYLTTPAAATGNQATANINYRSVASGNWSSASIWEKYDGSSWVAATSTPTSIDGTIAIQAGHTVAFDVSISVDELTIAATAQVTVNTSITMTVANGSGTDLTVNGYLKNQGIITLSSSPSIVVAGTYEHAVNGGIIPGSTWSTGSTCLVTGVTTTMASGYSQTFYNLTYNCTGQTANLNMGMYNTIINGDFNFLNGGAGAQETGLSLAGAGVGPNNVITIQGNFNVNSSVNTNQICAHRSGTASTVTNMTVNIQGNLNITSGSFFLARSTGIATLNWNLYGNLNMTGGVFNSSHTAALFHFAKTGTQSFTKTGGTLTAANIVIDGVSTVDAATSSFDGTCTLTISSGATLISANASGSITTTGTKTLNAASNYIFNGTVAQTTNTSLTAANNITVNNSAGVTLGTSTAVTGTLTLTSGKVTLGANTLILSNAISGASTSNYIVTNGAGLLKFLAVSSSSVTYHLGNSSSNYTPFTLTNSGTTSDIGVAVSSTITNALVTPAKAVALQWTVNSSAATSGVNATFNWNIGDQGASFNNTVNGDLGIYTGAGPYSLLTLGTLSGTSISKSGVSLAAGNNLMVIANTNAISIPAQAATTFSASSVTCNSMTVSWATGANATGTLVLYNSGVTPPNTNPISGTTYTAGNTIGNANVAYVGAGSSVSLIALLNNSTYNFKIYSYYGSGEDLAYLNSSILSGTQATSSIAAPTASSATNISSTSFTSNWGATCSESYQLDVSTNSCFLNFGSSSTSTEGFSGGTTAPSGWQITAGATYTSSGNFGAASPSLSLNATGQLVKTNQLSGAVATQMSFWIKGQGTNSISALLVEGTTDGTNWTTIENITNSLPTVATTKTYNSSSIPALPCGMIQFRFTYTKGAGNLAFDDISIISSTATASMVSGYNNLSVNGTNQAVTGLTENTTYYYRIRAVGAYSNSSNSNVISVTTLKDISTADFRFKANASGNWSVLDNWEYNSTGSTWSAATQLPSSTNNITVQSTSEVILDQNFVIGNGKTLTVNGTINTGTNVLSGTGAFTLTSGANLITSNELGVNGAISTSGTNSLSTAANYTFTGSTAQTSGSNLPSTVNNFTISNTAGVNLPQSLTVSGAMSISGSGTSFTINPNAVLTIAGTADFGGKSVTLKSDSSGTAAIGQVTGSLTGATNVTVERYIPAKRAWRALTAPLKGSNTTLYASWQNAGVSASPFNTGVELWGPSGTGMATGPAYNIRQYTTSGWTDITNTQSTNLFTSSANNAYMVFVTGGYGSNNIGNGQSAATTLKATGQLITGTVTVPVTSARHTLVGNPFASPLSPSAILAGNTQANLYTNIWMWDPAISTNGAYVNYDASINSGTFSDNSGSYASSSAAIQSGQAFFVRAVSGTDNLTLTESMKSSSISNTFRNNNSIAASVFRLGFAKKIGAEWMPLDGAIAAFYDTANASVDPADGTKMVNSSENMALVRGTTNLSIEHYPLVNATDQLNVKIWNTQQAHYKLKLNTEEFTMVGVEAWLQDLYTGTSQQLNLDGSAQDYEFDVDPTVSASSGNRFRIVFTNTALAVTNPEQGQLSIYPNPATGGKVTVSLPTGSFEGSSYELINVLGQVVRQDQITNSNSSQVSIPLKGLPNSWYALRIRKDNKVVYQGKLIIKN